MKKEFTIYASLHEESKEGWVWIPPLENIESEIIKITNPKVGRSIICEKRILDENHIKYYNKRPSTKNINNRQECIITNDYYRNKLGNLCTKEKVMLEIVEANGLINKYIRAPLCHPNPFLRMCIQLGIISVILGSIGLILGLISIFK